MPTEFLLAPINVCSFLKPVERDFNQVSQQAGLQKPGIAVPSKRDCRNLLLQAFCEPGAVGVLCLGSQAGFASNGTQLHAPSLGRQWLAMLLDQCTASAVNKFLSAGSGILPEVEVRPWCFI